MIKLLSFVHCPKLKESYLFTGSDTQMQFRMLNLNQMGNYKFKNLHTVDILRLTYVTRVTCNTRHNSYLSNTGDFKYLYTHDDEGSFCGYLLC